MDRIHELVASYETGDRVARLEAKVIHPHYRDENMVQIGDENIFSLSHIGNFPYPRKKKERKKFRA